MENFDPVGGGNLFDKLIGALFSFPEGGFFGGLVLVLRTLSIILIPVFFGLIVWLIPKLWEFRVKFGIRPGPFGLPVDKIAKGRWDEMISRLEGGAESDWALAIIEADNIVDDIFKRIGFQGESMAERISHLDEPQFPAVVILREAHRVRNNIAHTPGFKISISEAKRVLDKYKKVLEDLEVL